MFLRSIKIAAAALAAAMLLATGAQADWLPADLPFGDYLNEPVTGLAAPGPSDVWAATSYSYFADDYHTINRWNGNLYHSRNDGLSWDQPFDAYDTTPQFSDVRLFAVAFADRDHGWAFGVQSGGTVSTDVDQSSENGTASASDAWQSFTAHQSGSLVGVSVDTSGGPWTGTLTLYHGEGAGRTLICAQPVSGTGNGWQALEMNTPIPVTANWQYTFEIASSVPLSYATSSVNPDAGGQSSFDPITDLAYRTSVRAYSGKDFVPGPYAFLYTANRGITWTETALPNAETALADPPDFAIDAIDTTHAIAVQGHHVFETSDGTHWAERSGSFPQLFSVQAAGFSAPRAAGTDGTNAVAGALTPNGLAVDARDTGAFYATHFADSLHGFVAGGTASGTDLTGKILATADGGASWISPFTAPGLIIHGLAAPDAVNAWAAAERQGPPDSTAQAGSVGPPVPWQYGAVYRTEDAGANWALDALFPGRMYAVTFRDALHGWAAGEGGVYRWVPSLPAALAGPPPDARAILRGAAGLLVAAPAQTTATGEPLTLVDAVASLRRANAAPPDTLPEDDPARAVVVYNTATPDSDGDGVGDSEEVARYYAMRRGIPAANLVPITWSDPDSFAAHSTTLESPRDNWTDAFHTVIEPLRAKIDALGRDKVDIIAFTYGVPYQLWVARPDGSPERVPLDMTVSDLYRADAGEWSSAPAYAAPFTSVPERFGRYRFEQGGRPLGQPVVTATGGIARDPYYLVGRIDGPGVDACEAMVDNAIFAEQYRRPGGYDGTAYVDDRAEIYNYDQPWSLDDLRSFTPAYVGYDGYDKSIARTVLTFLDRGYPVKEETTNSQIGQPFQYGAPHWRDGTPATSAPRAMFYAGWYNYGTYNDVFEWLPGSVGIDFDSLSATAFRSPGFWGGSALSHGLTAMAGVIDEPYSYHPKPDALMEYLARGFSFAEACMLATDVPRTSEALFLGDPLYRPFRPHVARPMPVPTLKLQTNQTAGGMVVTLDSDIPVMATLQYTTDGTPPDSNSPSVEATPAFYALRHTFTLPASANLRIAVTATDPTSRVTKG